MSIDPVCSVHHELERFMEGIKKQEWDEEGRCVMTIEDED